MAVEVHLAALGWRLASMLLALVVLVSAVLVLLGQGLAGWCATAVAVSCAAAAARTVARVATIPTR